MSIAAIRLESRYCELVLVRNYDLTRTWSRFHSCFAARFCGCIRGARPRRSGARESLCRTAWRRTRWRCANRASIRLSGCTHCLRAGPGSSGYGVPVYPDAGTREWETYCVAYLLHNRDARTRGMSESLLPALRGDAAEYSQRARTVGAIAGSNSPF